MLRCFFYLDNRLASVRISSFTCLLNWFVVCTYSEAWDIYYEIFHSDMCSSTINFSLFRILKRCNPPCYTKISLSVIWSTRTQSVKMGLSNQDFLDIFLYRIEEGAYIGMYVRCPNYKSQYEKPLKPNNYFA